MRKLGTIRMTQHTPIGDDQSATSRIYLISIAYNEADFITYGELQKLRSEGTPVNIVGYYEIVHPEIMAGSWSQIMDDFRSMAEVQAERHGYIYYESNGGAYLAEQG
jgi:hypothetical protein